MKVEFLADLKLVNEHILSDRLPERSVLRNIVAPFLRKWLCDNGLRDIDPNLGKDIHVKVPINQQLLDYCGNGHAIFWHAFVPLGDFEVEGAAPVDNEKKPIPSSSSVVREINLNQFSKQKVGYSKVSGKPPKECFVKRDDAVRYFCNQRGGAHTHGQKNLNRIKPVIESMEMRIGIDLEKPSILFENELSQIDIRDESKLVYTFLHAITYDTFVKLCEALRKAEFVQG